MRLALKAEQSLFKTKQLEKIFQDALRVWKEVPFRVDGTDEFFGLLSDYGCAVEKGMVRFPPRVTSAVLERIAVEKERSSKSAPEEEPGHEIQLFTHGQALHICDLETNALRPATLSDLRAWCHAVDSLDGRISRHHPTFIPSGVPLGSRDFRTFAEICLHSRRPWRVSVYSAKMLPFFIEACRIAKGGSIEAVRQDPVFATKCWVNSPFMITRDSLEVAMAAREKLGVPVTFGHMPVAGGSCPVSVAGSLVQNTAESLALNAMRLATDGLCHGLSGTTTILDMRDACQRSTGMDLFLHKVATAQMKRYLFGGKREVIFSTNVSAQTVSAQSVYQKAMGMAFALAGGARGFGIGCLATSDVGSPVQLLIDYETARMFENLFRDVSADDDHIGVEEILSVAPQGARFMESGLTAGLFREECFFSDILDHRPPLSWVQNPGDLIERARRKARDLFGKAQNHCPLDDSRRGDIEKLIADAARLSAVSTPAPD